MPGKTSSKKLVNQATSDDLNPPAGFVLQQLATKTLGSVEECQIIEDLVVKKLDKNKPYVKHKALRIIKYICDNGHPSWRIAWQRHSDKIRACAHFRGPPDPIHGDAPYERVRAAAKVAMDAVFSTTTRDPTAIRQRIKGMSGDTPAAPTSKPPSASFKTGNRGVYSAPSGSGGSKMTGYGNTDYVPKARPEKFKAHKDPGTYNATALASNRHSNKKLDNRHTRAGKRIKGQVGGTWGDGEDASQEVEEDNWDEDYHDEPEYPRRTFGQTTTRPRVGGRVNTVKSDGTFEQNWVDGVAGGGGVGGRIADADLKKFVQQFENLSQSHALEALEDKLADGTWQQQAKSLTLIQALLKGASGDVVSDYIDDHPECIEDLMEENRSAVRKKAVAIAKTVGLLDEPEPVQAPTTTAPTQQASFQVEEPQVVEPVVQQQQQPEDDLLGFGAPTSTPAAAAPSSLFGNLTIQNGTTAQPAAVQPTPAVQQQPVVQRAVQPVPVAQPAPSNGPAPVNDLDWMSGLEAAPLTQAQPTQKTPSSFDPMSMLSSSVPTTTPATTQPVATSAPSSGFSFVQPSNPQPSSGFGFMSNPGVPQRAMPMTGMAAPPMTQQMPMQQSFGGMGGGYPMQGMQGMQPMGMNAGGFGGMMGQQIAQPMRQMPMMGQPMQQPVYHQNTAGSRFQHHGGDPFSTLLDPSPKAPPPKQQQQELFSEFSLK